MKIIELLSGALLVIGVLLFIAKYTFAYDEVGDLPIYFFAPGLLLQLIARNPRKQSNG